MGIGTKIADMITGGIGGKIFDIVDKFVPDKDQAAQLKQQLDLTKMVGELDLQKIEIESEAAVEIAFQDRVKAELHQNDTYTKRTRPMIARQSFYAGLGYVLLTAIPVGGIDLRLMLIMPWTFSWEVLMLLYSPALTYMGVRGFEKWKNGNI